MARPAAGWIGGGDDVDDRRLGSLARRRALAFSMALSFLLESSAVVSGLPLQKLAARTTSGRISDDSSAASAAAYSADNVQASSQLQPWSRHDPTAALVLSRAGENCLEPDGCDYPEESLTSDERRQIGDQSLDDDEAVSTASRERGLAARGYTDVKQKAAQAVERSAHELVGDPDEYDTEDHDPTTGGGSGGGDGGDDNELEEESAERRQPGGANFGSAEPGGQLSSNKIAIAVDDDETGGNSSDDNDDEDDSINAIAVAAADGEPPTRRGDPWSTAAEADGATTASAVGVNKEVNGDDTAARAVAEDGGGGGDTLPPAPKMPQPPPCSGGAPEGVSLDELKTPAVGGKGLRSAADANATIDNENLSAVLATTFGSVSVVLLLIINGFVIRRTWVHGCWQKKSQVLLRPRRVAFRRRNNHYGTARNTEPDETEM